MNIKDAKFFQGIDAGVVEEIKNAGHSKSFKTGDVIFWKGNQADFLYILDQGQVNLVVNQQGNTALDLDEAGEVFGWSSIVENGVYTSTATSRADSSVFCIPRQELERVFEQNAEAAILFYKRIGTIFSKRLSRPSI